MKTKYMMLLGLALMTQLPAFAQSAPGIAGPVKNFDQRTLEWMPLATVMTAVFALCILLVVVGVARKLDAILEEMRRSNQSNRN